MKYMLLIYLDEQGLSETQRQECYVEYTQLAQEIHSNGWNCRRPAPEGDRGPWPLISAEPAICFKDVTPECFPLKHAGMTDTG